MAAVEPARSAPVRQPAAATAQLGLLTGALIDYDAPNGRKLPWLVDGSGRFHADSIIVAAQQSQHVAAQT